MSHSLYKEPSIILNFAKITESVPLNSIHNEEVKDLKQELANEIESHQVTKQQYLISRVMSKSFWERWQFELDRCKELQKEKREMKFSFNHGLNNQNSATEQPCAIPKINRSLLRNPAEFGRYPSDKVFVGRVSFGVVKYQLYCGIHVAVKEFLPHTLKESVLKEAAFLVDLCHLYLPLLFGIPYSRVNKLTSLIGASFPIGA